MEATAPPRSGEQFAEVSDEITLCYEEFGAAEDEPMLLVMGLGMQMLGWDEGFCELLASEGYRVIRYDNRDTGHSTKLRGRVNLRAGMLGMTGSAVYTLDEMALDAAGLLDHLELESAHVVGASMGGMIGQKLAVRQPERVRSLCSIMSGTGGRSIQTVPRPAALKLLLRTPAGSRDSYIEDWIDTLRVIGSPGYPRDEGRLRELAGISYDRSFHPAGTARQMMAVMASGNRTAELRKIAAPTLVIHGAADPLVPKRAGRDVAEAVQGARYEEIEGMGHDLPPALWERLVSLIAANAARAAA